MLRWREYITALMEQMCVSPDSAEPFCKVRVLHFVLPL